MPCKAKFADNTGGISRNWGAVRAKNTPSDCANVFVQSFLKDAVTLQELDDYEQDERFTPEWAEPQDVIEVNLTRNHGSKNQVMIKREAMVLEHLIKEGCFSTP